jgi:hypothetical protein
MPSTIDSVLCVRSASCLSGAAAPPTCHKPSAAACGRVPSPRPADGKVNYGVVFFVLLFLGAYAILFPYLWHGLALLQNLFPG